MSDPLLPVLLLSMSQTSSSSSSCDSSSNSSDASASSGSSAPSVSVRLSPLAEAEEGDMGEVCADGGRSPLNAFVGADQLMLDLELLGFSCIEAEAVEGVARAEAGVAVVGEDGGEAEERVEAVDVVMVDEDEAKKGEVAEEEGVAKKRGQTEGKSWAEERGQIEGKSWAEERGLAEELS